MYCTFLDASKPFDRVRYCTLFRSLVIRGLLAGIIRILINLYAGNSVRNLRAGLASDYFTARSGVKQGGIIGTILFCIYIDNLLLMLSLSTVECLFLV